MAREFTEKEHKIVQELTDECSELNAQIKKLEAELKTKKSTLGMYVDMYDLKEVIGDKGTLTVTTQHRFKCWEDNGAKIKELPKDRRLDLCVPNYQAIKKEVEAGTLPCEILEGALFKDVQVMTIKERNLREHKDLMDNFMKGEVKKCRTKL